MTMNTAFFAFALGILVGFAPAAVRGVRASAARRRRAELRLDELAREIQAVGEWSWLAAELLDITALEASDRHLIQAGRPNHAPEKRWVCIGPIPPDCPVRAWDVNRLLDERGVLDFRCVAETRDGFMALERLVPAGRR